MAKKEGVICLFDVDGTLTVPRKEVDPETTAFLAELRTKVTIGVVGGSDLVKQQEQLGANCLDLFDYFFSENGLAAYKAGQLTKKTSIKEHLGDAKLKPLINFILAYIANLDIPVKRGTFIEFRNGMLNVSPIGRNCNQEERDEFEKLDNEHGWRKTMVAQLQEKFADLGLTYSIGGQISFDVFPAGWDKTFALQFLEPPYEPAGTFKEVHFFGDKTYKGGNDYEIYESPKTIGHSVTCPADTIKICKELFMS
jgi:phosphomannomutase